MIYPSVFAFGLVGLVSFGMGPVTIAVDSYGPVTDNAQSVYELSLIEEVADVKTEIEKEFGFTPDFENAKQFLEENDGAGNTFKATSKTGSYRYSCSRCYYNDFLFDFGYQRNFGYPT